MGIITLSNSTPITFVTPADPNGTTSTTGVMMGLAVKIIPAFSGRVKITVIGNLTNSTGTAGNGAKAQIRWGVGAAPTNAAALAGTAVGSMLSSVLERATANDLRTFAAVAVITGLAIGVECWSDVSLGAIVAGTALAKNLTVIMEEL